MLNGPATRARSRSNGSARRASALNSTAARNPRSRSLAAARASHGRVRPNLLEVRAAGCAQVFPVLDLLDVAPVDVPQLGRAAVVAPVLVRQCNDIRQAVKI